MAEIMTRPPTSTAWIHALVASAVLIGSAPAAQGQFGLNKIKKAVDKGLEVAQAVDELTFTLSEEVELGRAISQRIRAKYGVSQQVEPTRYVALVGLTLARKSERSELPWRWIILDSSSVNAFATPGGFIHITRGALASIRSEAELAGVLAHEIGHVTAKHTLEALKKGRGMELAQEGSSLTAGSPLFEALTDEATDAILAGFGRKEELESDQIGIGLASAAGYSPRGLIEFLETLAAISTGSSAGLFRSHPETEERIKKIDKAIRRDQLDGSVTLMARYESSIPYRESTESTGGPAVEGARGAAAADNPPAIEDSTEAEQDDADEGNRFSLAKLKNPFAMGSEEESTEVSGAGAGRAVGEEDDSEESGAKNPNPVEVSITPDDVTRFIREGGLS